MNVIVGEGREYCSFEVRPEDGCHDIDIGLKANWTPKNQQRQFSAQLPKIVQTESVSYQVSNMKKRKLKILRGC